jgi:lactoylglutathione lyase
VTRSLDHVGLSVESLEEERAFYEQAFGFISEFEFELERGDIRGAMLRNPAGGRLELFEHVGSVAGMQARTPNEALRTRGYGHFALSTEDIRSAFEQALLAGATSMVEPAQSPEPGVLLAFVADPEGNLVELLQR